jgi:hypothetical protein
MSFRQYALTLLVALAAAHTATAQPAVAPQSGVLVLRNGHVLEGDVTRAGDYYIVSRGEGIEVRSKADEVELFCGSMIEAYEFKLRHLAGVAAKPHLELAKWCLRHGMYEQCAEQLATAKRLELDSAELRELETRLKLVTEAPSVAGRTSSSPGVPLDEMEKVLRELPRGSVEKFGAIVQPILLNRCSANQCHGPNSKSEFRLLRPPAGQIVSRRFTQRNLYAALKQLNAADAESSPLLVLPQQRHGSALAAVFDKHSAGQLAELVAWARLTVANSPAAPATRPTTIATPQTTLSQPATHVHSDAPVEAHPEASSDSNDSTLRHTVRMMRPSVGGASPPPAQPAPFRPRDLFDPEIFNRRYFGK